MEKNEELVGVVSGIGSNGEGIIKQNGTVVFVPFTLIGEKVRYKVLKVKAGYVEGKYLDIAGVKALAAIPSKEVLVAQLLGLLTSPMRSLAIGLSEVAKKKEA